jgi:hypothetical protein
MAKQYSGIPPKTCDICKKNLVNVFFDAKTKMGPWANLCQDCFNKQGVGLGIGKGQKYTIGENK